MTEGYVAFSGGDEGIRTLDLSVANAALSQLSYIPTGNGRSLNRSRHRNQFKKALSGQGLSVYTPLPSIQD